MRRHERFRLIAIAACTAVAAACGASDASAPNERISDRHVSGDTGTTTTPATTRIHGRVLLSAAGRATVVTDTTPPGTLAHDPVPGATVRVRRNQMVNGVATQELVATVTADAAGRYEIPTLPGGYYVVYASPPDGTALGESWELVPIKADVEVNVYLREP